MREQGGSILDSGIKENADVGLHDCRSDRIRLEDRSVTFYIPDGFYFIRDAGSAENHSAEMCCHFVERADESFSVSVYRKNLFGQTVREDRTDWFVSAVNAKKIEFEFVYTYRSYHGILFKGYIWRHRKPWGRECEVELRTDEITYSWIDR